MRNEQDGFPGALKLQQGFAALGLETGIAHRQHFSSMMSGMSYCRGQAGEVGSGTLRMAQQDRDRLFAGLPYERMWLGHAAAPLRRVN
jgi:hypothetical protein